MISLKLKALLLALVFTTVSATSFEASIIISEVVEIGATRAVAPIVSWAFPVTFECSESDSTSCCVRNSYMPSGLFSAEFASRFTDTQTPITKAYPSFNLPISTSSCTRASSYFQMHDPSSYLELVFGRAIHLRLLKKTSFSNFSLFFFFFKPENVVSDGDAVVGQQCIVQCCSGVQAPCTLACSTTSTAKRNNIMVQRFKMIFWCKTHCVKNSHLSLGSRDAQPRRRRIHETQCLFNSWLMLTCSSELSDGEWHKQHGRFLFCKWKSGLITSIMGSLRIKFKNAGFCFF